MEGLPAGALEQVAAYFRALSEPTRLHLLNELREMHRLLWTRARDTLQTPGAPGVPPLHTPPLQPQAQHAPPLGPPQMIGAPQGLGIADPSAVKVVETAGATFLLVASAGSSSISVVALGADGSMQVADHVIDTLDTRFQGV